MSARNSLALLAVVLVVASPAASALFACACNPCPLGAPVPCESEQRDCCDAPEAPDTCACIHPDSPNGLPVESETPVLPFTTSVIGEVHLPALSRVLVLELRPEGHDPPGPLRSLYLLRVLRF